MKMLKLSNCKFFLKRSSLNKIVILSLILVFLFSAGGLDLHFAQASSTPVGVAYSVPITVTNTQSIATPVPFQQMITVNSAAYSSIEASNLQNVEFFDSSGNVIPSWLESGNANTATNTVYWLRIAAGIPADSSVTVYLGFFSSSTNLFNAQTIGEAPQLSPVYGEYDNGATVFIYYTNFAGNSLPSGWTAYNPSSISYSVNNGLTVTNNVFVSGGDPQLYYTTALSNPYNTVIDTYMNVKSDAAEFMGYFYGPNGAAQDTGIGGRGTDNVWSIFNFDGNIGSYNSMNAGSVDSNWHVLSYFPSTSAGNGWLDYTYFTTYGGNFNFVGSQPGLFGEGTYQQPATALWFRQRALPPDSIMPSVNVLSISSSTTPPFSLSSTAPSSTTRNSSTFLYVIVIVAILVVAIAIVGILIFFRNRKSKRNAAVTKVSSSGAVTSSSQFSEAMSPQALQRLEQLKSMLDKGLITQADYDEQKKKLLGKQLKH